MKKIRIIAALLALSMLTACNNMTNEAPESIIVSAVSSSAVQSKLESSVQSTPESSEQGAGQSSFQSTSSEPVLRLPISSESYSEEDKPLCTCCALYCVENKELIVGENINDRVAPASLTKLLTATVALKYVDPGEVFTVGTELQFVQPDSSLAMIAQGQRLKLYDLITGMLLPSGNDAAYTVAVSVARKVSGSAEMSDERAVEYFCDLMNKTARELGMNGSHFADPDGWDNDEHYTTVSDLIKLAEHALTVPEIREIVAYTRRTVEFETGEVADWVNGNVFINPRYPEYYRESAIGMKTGTTDNAGYCFIGAFVKGGKTYITVVVGSELWEDRNEKTLQLIDSVQ